MRATHSAPKRTTDGRCDQKHHNFPTIIHPIVVCCCISATVAALYTVMTNGLATGPLFARAISPSQTPLPFSRNEVNQRFTTPTTTAPTARYSSRPRPPPLRPLDLIALSPFGTYCRQCGCPVSSARGCLRSHLSKHPEVEFGGFSVDDFVQFAAREVDKLKKGELSAFVTGETVSGFSCARCGSCFRRKDNAQRHSHGRTSKCDESDMAAEDISMTVCGRLVASSKVAVIVPAGAKIPYLTTEAWLEHYVSRDEKASQYLSIFHAFSQQGNCDDTMSRLVDCWCESPGENEPELADLLQLSQVWMSQRARYDAGTVPANYRAAIMVFDGQDVGEIGINYTYNFRHFEANLVPELAYLLAFAWRRGDRVVGRFKRSYGRLRTSPFFVPQILHALFIESTPNFFQQPILVEYCLSRSFRKSGGGTLSMIKCGLAASQIAAAMSLLRAATCGVLCSFHHHADRVAPQIVRHVRTSRVANILCPHIRHLKEMNSRKGSNKIKTITPEGTINVDEYEFPREVWSKLIPDIFSKCRTLLRKLLLGDNWEKLFDTSLHLSVSFVDYQYVKYHASLSDGSVLSSDDVTINPAADDLDYDRLVSYLSLGVFGCGGGATRATEVKEVLLSQATWHRNTLYYETISNKSFSFRTQGTAKPIEHKLPTVLGRVFLLLRSVTNPVADLDIRQLVPRRRSSNHSMNDAVVELFNFSSVPGSTQIRQFFTSISDVLFPSTNWDGLVVATGNVAEMAAHSRSTHQASYGSSLVGGRELIYRVFHRELGGEDYAATLVEMSQQELLSALRSFFGHGATYTSRQQQDLVSLIANETTRHAHIGMPCGSGKSMAWMVPTVARVLAGKKSGTIVVVLPYKFLVDYHLNAARDKLGGTYDISTLGLTGKDIRQSSALPDGIKDKTMLPAILFLSLEALVNLLKFHHTTLNEWAVEHLIHRFIIDEVHTIYGESFRSAYEALPQLARYGIPIATMSGTVPRPLIPFLLPYLGLCLDDTLENLDLVETEDCLGSFPIDFNFLVHSGPRSLNSLATEVVSILTKNAEHGVHILVSVKVLGDKVLEALTTRYTCRMLTSDTTEAIQETTAKEWSDGKFQVLISTTVALVGNENAKCRHVLMLGYLYNLMNVIQAIGRLRPKQRQGGASVQIYIPNMSEEKLERMDLAQGHAFQSLKSRKLIGNDKELHTRVASVRGLHDWLVNDKGCRIQNLARRYGFEKGQCRVCDVCRGSVIRPLVARAEKKVRKSTATMNRGMVVFMQMLEKCLFCNKKSCTGESCLGKNCYRCGGKHFTKACLNGETATKVLEGKACYHCFDLYERRGYTNHDMKNCPLKRRLRRMVFSKFNSSTGDFGSFLNSIFCEKDSFYTFLASLEPTM
jgi:superfamily II DNA helicase RecQ